MKVKILLLSVLIIPFFAIKAQEPIQIKKRSQDKAVYSAPDSLGVRHLLKTSGKISAQHLPYPILFIHGLNSNSGTWNDFTNYIDTAYGLVFGGRIDVCLNHDGDNSVANLDFYPSTASDIAFFTGVSDLAVADYYYLNFDVGQNGSVYPTTSTSDYVISNQSAIYKQGVAVKHAIDFILQKTGRKEIVLMTHSMGGLASRQYLQHPFMWQDSTLIDGHKVAKLVTTGTPHGGSNASGGVLTGAFSDLDESSEAVRDLRRTYFYSGDSGVFLFGGYEDAVTMDDQLFGSFYNFDVNCNGTENEFVTGLNHKTLPQTLDYSCIIGDCSGCFYSGGDGIVSLYSADLGNFYNIPYLKRFYYYASALTEIHTDLPGLVDFNLKGLDEPDLWQFAYHVDLDTSYLAFITNQTDTSGEVDVDLFEFSLANSGRLTAKAFNIGVHNLSVKVYDANYNLVNIPQYSNGADSVVSQTILPAGNYFLEFADSVSSQDHLKTYNFILTFDQVTGVSAEQAKREFVVYPNPSEGNITITTVNNNKLQAVITDMSGKVVYNETLINKLSYYIDLSHLSKGMYFIQLQNNNKITTQKLIIK